MRGSDLILSETQVKILKKKIEDLSEKVGKDEEIRLYFVDELEKI